MKYKIIFFLMISFVVVVFSVHIINTNYNSDSYSYEKNDYDYSSSSNYSFSDYEEEEEIEEKPNHPSWCMGSWRIQVDDVNVMIASIYSSEITIKIMRGFTLADSERLENWTLEDGVLYMYNGTNKYGGYQFMADERNKMLYHNGRAMQKH